MSTTHENVKVIVLAAQRRNALDPLAANFGLTHKCLVPLQDRPLIAHVLDVVASHPRVRTVAISVETDAFGEVERAISGIAVNSAQLSLMASSDNLADSVSRAAADHDGILLITTADNALLTHASIDAMLDTLRQSDAAIAMAPRSAVLHAHPSGQRRFYRFRDGEYSNCNLYALANVHALRAAEIFRGGGQFAKKTHRLITAFGLLNLILLRLRMISLDQAMRRISARFGVSISPVVLQDGSQAIDVDNDRTYAIVNEILAMRTLRGKYA